MDFKKDGRAACKYGTDCYQKNPEHRAKYRHPEKSEKARSPPKKRPRSDSPKDDSPPKTPEEPQSSQKSRNENVEYVKLDDLKKVEDKIKRVFLLDMPKDFYSFYDFCKMLSPKQPHKALSSLKLELVGPYDLFHKQLSNFTKEEGLRHSRYYYDPPEFLTVLKGDEKSGLHYGYFRDEPSQMPVFVAKNEAELGCAIHSVAGNIFGALHTHIARTNATPFAKMQIDNIQKKLKKWGSDHDFTLDSLTPAIKERRSAVVAKTFHGAGLVVPYDKKTQVGYRELAESNKTLRSLFDEIEACDDEKKSEVLWGQLQHVITFANIANDECDFGASIELGLDMFCSGSSKFHRAALGLLKTGYNLIGRSEFAEIIDAHLSDRRKGYVKTIC